jgi:copper chaperone CopZ
VKTEVYMPGANCPLCLNTIRSLLLDDPRVDSVHMSFPNRCLEVEHSGVPSEDLVRMLQQNLHGIEVAGNGERVMVEVVPQIGEWHCHPPSP